MDHRNKLLVFLIAIFLFVFCKKKNTDTIVAPQLTVSSVEELFTADGGSSEVAVSSNLKWSVSNAVPWCTATTSATGGNGKIFLNVQPNPSATERLTIVLVSSG